MKLVAYLLVVCLMSLISISWATPIVSKADCCEKASCKHPHGKKQDRSCGDNSCGRMLSCNRCVFLVEEQLLVSVQTSIIIDKQPLQLSMGTAIDFADTDWHPPKA